jgi:uncharacterized protein HemY
MQRQYPDQAVGYVIEGDAELAAGRTVPAIEAMRRGLDKKNRGPLAGTIHALLLREKRDAEAQQFATSWMKGHPDDALFIGYLGDAELSAKNWAAARRYYDQLLKLDANNVGALNNIAWILLQNKDPESMAFIQKALAVAPDQPDVLDTLSQIHASRKEYSQAIGALRKAINRATSPSKLQISLAQVLLASGDRTSAIDELQKLVDRGKGAPNYAQARKLLAELRSQ